LMVIACPPLLLGTPTPRQRLSPSGREMNDGAYRAGILVPELAFAATPHVVYDGYFYYHVLFRRHGQGKIRSGEGDY
jgi:hypothetical protein